METIKSSREIDSIFRESAKATHPLLMVLAARTPDQYRSAGRVAFIAGKRLGPAVLRNRCRRVLRESVRRCGGPWATWDVAIVARAQTASATPGEIDDALLASLQRAGVL